MEENFHRIGGGRIRIYLGIVFIRVDWMYNILLLLLLLFIVDTTVDINQQVRTSCDTTLQIFSFFVLTNLNTNYFKIITVKP